MSILNNSKTFALLLTLFSVYSSYAQTNLYSGFGSEYFFGRQFSSRAEAMGQSFTSIDGDASSIHFNPAGVGNLDGIEISSTYATPYYIFKDANKLSINVASRVAKKWSIGYSKNLFDYNSKSYVTNPFGTILDSSENSISNNKVTVAFSAEPTFNIGGSIGMTNFEIAGLSGKSLQIDFGVIKKFEFSRFKNNQSLNIGTTFKNPMGTETTLKLDSFSAKSTLPIIMQSGVSYYYSSEKTYKDLNILKLITAIEYQTLFNSGGVFNKYSAGLELSLLEILHLRSGYYLQSVEDFGNPKNKSELKDLTYGIGVSVPFNKFTKLPINISLDYCSLPQPTFIENQTWDNFQSFSGSVRYILF